MMVKLGSHFSQETICGWTHSIHQWSTNCDPRDGCGDWVTITPTDTNNEGIILDTDTNRTLFHCYLWWGTIFPTCTNDGGLFFPLKIWHCLRQLTTGQFLLPMATVWSPSRLKYSKLALCLERLETPVLDHAITMTTIDHTKFVYKQTCSYHWAPLSAHL